MVAGISPSFASAVTRLSSRTLKNSEFAKQNVGSSKSYSRLSCRRLSSSKSVRRFGWFLRCMGGLRAWLRRGPHPFAQPHELGGGGRQREYPADTGQTAMTGLAETGDRLGPAEHLLNALAHPPTDRIARVAGRSTVNCRPPVRCVLRDMRRHIVLAQIGDEAGHIIGLVGTARDPVIAR